MADQNNAARSEADRAAEEIAPTLLQYLRRRYRLLVSDHDDLVQETLADYLYYLRSRPGKNPVKTEVPAIVFTILKRRVADRLRGEARRAVKNLPKEDFPGPADAPDIEQTVRYRKLLTAVLGLLSELGDGDQKLLLREHLSSNDVPLSPNERKRISRLRERLREQLKARFGVSLEDYLGG